MRTAKTTLCMIALATTLFAESTSTFEVKEISPSDLVRLNSAEDTLSKSITAFTLAKQSMEKARNERDSLVSKIKSDDREYEGACTVTQYGTDMGASFPISSSKSFRRIEIRGKYLLISSGTESCMRNWLTGTGTISVSPVTASHVDFGSK